MKVWCLMMRIGVLAGISPLLAGSEKKDPIEAALRDAFQQYQEKNYSETTETLREVIKMLEDKNAKRVEVVLPEVIGFWQGNDLQRDDLSTVGGGLSIKRSYQADKKSITVKLVKDSPFVKKWIELLGNEELIALSGKRIHTISGESAIMESESKLLIVLDERVLLEVVGDGDCSSKDVVGFTRMLDIGLMKKMK